MHFCFQIFFVFNYLCLQICVAHLLHLLMSDMIGSHLDRNPQNQENQISEHHQTEKRKFSFGMNKVRFVVLWRSEIRFLHLQCIKIAAYLIACLQMLFCINFKCLIPRFRLVSKCDFITIYLLVYSIHLDPLRCNILYSIDLMGLIDFITAFISQKLWILT